MTSKPSSKSSARKPLAEQPVRPSKHKPGATRASKPRATAKTSKAEPAAAVPAPKPAREKAIGAAPAPGGELSAEVMEFINAVDEYKRQRRRPFPSWSEIFEIVKALGYQKSA